MRENTDRALRDAAQTRIHKIRKQLDAVTTRVTELDRMITRMTTGTTTATSQEVARTRLHRRLVDQRRGELLRQLSVAMADMDALCPAGPLCPRQLPAARLQVVR